ncbi:MAG: hypothetical protein H6742_18735 [Alphaproteobacteria bacterium]|nr:hypothetical protein [Alphaproteobacteria bacterium]
MKSFLLQAHLATAAVMVGASMTPSVARADVADDTYQPGGDEDADSDTDGSDDEADDDDGCGSKATSGASLGLGLLFLAGLKRRWD